MFISASACRTKFGTIKLQQLRCQEKLRDMLNICFCLADVESGDGSHDVRIESIYAFDTSIRRF